MNWKQIYTSATPEERLQLVVKMLEAIEVRKRRYVLAGWRIIRNRRRQQIKTYHRVGGDRRSPLPQWKRAFMKTARHVSIVLSVGALSGGVATLALSVSA